MILLIKRSKAGKPYLGYWKSGSRLPMGRVAVDSKDFGILEVSSGILEVSFFLIQLQFP